MATDSEEWGKERKRGKVQRWELEGERRTTAASESQTNTEFESYRGPLATLAGEDLPKSSLSKRSIGERHPIWTRTHCYHL